MTFKLPEPRRIQTHGYKTVACYTAEQMRQTYEQGRADMREEAAKECEMLAAACSYEKQDAIRSRLLCAKSIRSLI